jgi:hypothetical protein
MAMDFEGDGLQVREEGLMQRQGCYSRVVERAGEEFDASVGYEEYNRIGS